jgi:hypothetical protein
VFYEGDDWDNRLVQSGEEKAFPYANIAEAMKALGDLGWELVAISPRSSYLGGHSGTSSDDCAGFTSEEIWVFKRPQEE